MSMKVIIIEDTVFPIDEHDSIALTSEEYIKYVDNTIPKDKSIYLMQVWYRLNKTSKTALDIPGAELYDLSKLTAAQIKGLLKAKPIK